MKIKQRGFTLVEVLIVVVIIAILAALILPRLTQQTENAYIAEAQNMLGTIRRAQINHCDISECTGTTSYQVDPAVLGLNKTQGTIQATAPQIQTTSWNYTIANTGTNFAVRRTGALAGGRVTLSLAGTYTCASGYQPVMTGTNTRGCKT